MRFRLPLLTAAVTLAASSCTSSTFLSKNVEKHKDDEDNRRPSEQGEGLVGYLTDPSAVAFHKGNGQVTVTGGAEAVRVDAGDVANLPICLQQIGADDLHGLLQARARFGGGSVKTIARGAASADGSFSVTGSESDVDQTKLLTLNVTGQCQTDDGASALDAAKTSIVFKDLTKDDGFGGASKYFPDVVAADASSPAAATPASASLFCKEATDECSGKIAFHVHDAGTSKVIAEITVTLSQGGKDLESVSWVGDATLYLVPDNYTVVVAAKGYLAYRGTWDPKLAFNGDIALSPQ